MMIHRYNVDFVTTVEGNEPIFTPAGTLYFRVDYKTYTFERCNEDGSSYDRENQETSEGLERIVSHLNRCGIPLVIDYPRDDDLVDIPYDEALEDYVIDMNLEHHTNDDEEALQILPKQDYIVVNFDFRKHDESGYDIPRLSSNDQCTYLIFDNNLAIEIFYENGDCISIRQIE